MGKPDGLAEGEGRNNGTISRVKLPSKRLAQLVSLGRMGSHLLYKSHHLCESQLVTVGPQFPIFLKNIFFIT